jgi:lambda family phage tail tape measure protein
MQNAFAEFFDATGDGFLKLESLATGVAGSIYRALSDALVAEAIGSVGKSGGAGSGLLGWLFSAKGNVFSAGALVPFARGGVVHRPTVFPFASGIGLMGEVGPEAIMPLTRTPGGDLGVRAQGGGASTHNYFISALDAKSFDDMLRSGKARIVEMVGTEMRRNGSLRGTMRSKL